MFHLRRAEFTHKKVLVTLVASTVLATLGTFLMYGVGQALLPASMPSTFSPFMSAGAICLLAAAYAGVLLVTVNDRGSRKGLGLLASPGLALVLLAPFLPFPVGCNVWSGCPMSPYGTWSTVWPNMLVLSSGLVLASVGFAAMMPQRSPAVGAGTGMIMSGLALVAFGYSFGYMTSCAANGCLPLTTADWWSLYWPNVLAISSGWILIISGGVAVTSRVVL